MAVNKKTEGYLPYEYTCDSCGKMIGGGTSPKQHIPTNKKFTTASGKEITDNNICPYCKKEKVKITQKP